MFSRQFQLSAPRATSVVALLTATALAGCGGSSPAARDHSASSTAAAGTVTDGSSPGPGFKAGTPAAIRPRPRVLIEFPPRGAHTGSTLTVRVSAIGVSPAAVRYRLDGGHVRRGALRFLLPDLPPGRHRLVLTLAGARGATATTVFVVAAPPAPAPQPAPATSQAPSPPPPPPETTTTTTSSAAAPTGIPQGADAGDGDGDNHGGPSDGDGNI
jgi:hypothetical protein